MPRALEETPIADSVWLTEPVAASAARDRSPASGVPAARCRNWLALTPSSGVSSQTRPVPSGAGARRCRRPGLPRAARDRLVPSLRGWCRSRRGRLWRAGLAADLAFEITLARNLVPLRPGRRHERKTKRPGGRYKTRKPGETTRLTPLTRTVFWLMPVPALTQSHCALSSTAARWISSSAGIHGRRRNSNDRLKFFMCCRCGRG
jgi:hypothetical protein